MDRKYYQDNEFEQFLQEELKDHRMYPADDAWKNIRTHLHGNPAWPALTVISLLVIVSLTISTLLIAPSADRFKFVATTTTKVSKPAVETRMHAPAPKEAYYQAIEPNHITEQTITQLREPVATVPTLANPEWQMAHTIISSSAITTVPTINEELIANNEAKKEIEVYEEVLPLALKLNATETISSSAALAGIGQLQLAKSAEETSLSINLNDEKRTQPINNAISLPIPNKRIGFQFYITPSTSYRSLSDAQVKEIIQPTNIAAAQNVPLALNYTAGVNDVVRHRPAMGLEVGLAALYNINSKLKFKTGIQVNIRQYHIETFKANTGLATVSLINNGSVENLNMFSNYNNSGGYKQEQLDNKSFQVALPVGVQWDIIKGKQFGISAEATVQPTYSFNSSVFLLSTDFKNYTDGNEFVRRWNINTSAGIHVNFKSGSNLWQLGPQIRYQHLPTYTNRYPIKEYLMDYGIRLAFTKQR
ncbi:outer membrane beta-barrel protein [Sediminibacterium sp.]|uniref:outer membrane beta-barrel protein n=1 Tax=Sediminibacterium sp. TaxID=1917865 RepID=UPI0027349846|nr:outer membrane beta-barrel protein [Sediminibacterium sp.]MDP3392361.1 outer membrane beta-barrel protein [Sediminibacterium sp.]MDP3566837.1 outer membrane beta-barrel protein [Sediminibacterium sp.]